MNKFCINLLRIFIAAIATSIAWLHVAAQDSANQYPYRLQDRYGDPFSWKSYNRFDIDTSLIKRTIIYDSVTKSYYIIEKFDSIRYRYPAAFSRSDFLNVQGLNDETDYYNNLSRSLSMLNYKQPRPKPRVFSSLFNRIFGLTPDGKKMDITSSGNIDLQLGYQGQNVQNPTLSEQARKTGSFNMNASADLSVIAQIGNKLRLPISYNTNGFFQFNNQLKLNYQGTDDEILKSVQAGNVSFQTKGSLMASMQNLFGIEAQLHFGNLIVTGVIANDRSQKQSVTTQGGGLSQNINISMGDYDENRNFLLGNYFVRHYNETMTTLPRANTLIKILRTEVWITNKSGADTSVRTVVGLMDLGENNPYNTNIHSLNSFNGLPSNSANDLYAALQSNPAARNSSTVATLLNARGLIQTADYEQTYARKLDTTEYVLNPQAGFIALSQQLQPDQVLAIAYQYSYNGRIFQVGEFSSDVALDSSQGTQKVLFLKLLKSSQQRTDLPLWNLEMKNVYSLNVFGMDSSSFNLNVYYQQPSGGTNPYLPQTAQSVSGKSIISILGADKLNYRNDPGADGQFDYVPKFTVIPSQGKIIFPVLQPFGKDLDSLAYNGISQDIKNKYVYYQLYDSLKVIANTFANVNKFILQGVIKGSSNSVINIGAANVPQGSVIVTAGGRTLVEGVDYTVNYSLGQVQIINQTILDGNTAVNVQFENNANLGTAQRNFMGLRFDYTVNKKLSIGATYEKLSEQPYTFRTNYGEDPINNSMYGIDFNYHSDWPQLTKWLNKLPFYSSSAPSNITAYGEAAVLKPGHPKQIGSGENGKVYIDDFESSSNAYDLRTPFTSWSLASTPAGNGLFPEATLNNNLDYGKNRAQLSWYTIEPILQDKNSTSNPLFKNLSELSDPRVRPIYASELFPNQSTLSATLQTTTFDLSYYPTERGPYNFTDDPTNMDAQGHLLNPQKRWGGIMRSMDQTDFTSDNVEYIEVWMQDPFIKTPNSIGGKLMIDLGNVSEDVLKDGKRMYENGLSKSGNAEDSTSSIWGTVPTNPIQLVNAFSNDVDERNYQDVGFDGLNDDGERRKRLDYLNDLKNSFGENSPIYQAAYNDPSNDNYKWYRDPNFTSNDGILARYKHYNGTQGNSPVATNSSSASTTYPDNEDLNADNTMNQNEQYYEYEVDLKPNMVLTDKYVSDVRDVQPRLANDSITHEHWYLLRIPITDFTNKIGNIAGFNSIRFMRMYLTGFQDSATVRFAELSLIRNTWRPFTFKLDTSDNYTNLPNDNTSITITQVNTQDNSLRTPIPYKMPPGVQQLQTLQGTGSVSNGSTYIEKEQSMSLNISNLKQNDSRAVIKSMNMDMRQYGQMSMYIHAESVPGQTPVNNNDLVAVIRLGQDYISNYYEIRIPLKVTLPNASASQEEIWPDSNRLLVALQDLVNLKMERNASRIALNKIYSEQFGNETYAVKGNPNLAAVTSYLIGIENAANSQPVSTTVWTDELSLSKINEKGGWAAQGRVDVQLADLGSVSLSANTYSAGFGTIEQNVSEREMNSMIQYDASLNIDAGKLFPQKFGFSIPFFASLNKTILTPKYDPYSQDIIFKDELKNYSASQKDSAKNLADDITTTKTISFTNVRFGKPSIHPKIWSISNFDFSYTFTSINQTNPLVSQNTINQYNGNFGYTFSGQPRFWQPFKRLFHNKSPWLSFIRDFNINPTPSLLSFRYTINRQSSVYTPRVINPYDVDTDIDTAQTIYDNYFNLTRNYNLNWNLTKSLNIDFTATNLSVVDVPNRRLNKTDKDSIWHSFWRGGRNTQYSQTATMSYTLPFNKFPMFDWINAQYSYSANYNWIAANLQSVSLGNVIENGNTSNFNGQFNFRNLYNKSKLLKSVLNPSNNFNQSPPTK
ncbi:MAG: cell surface protein SprA [Arachidicoccus sp.]|nr:cell surface protein SprA [Arachidicoccus sp.]